MQRVSPRKKTLNTKGFVVWRGRRMDAVLSAPPHPCTHPNWVDLEGGWMRKSWPCGGDPLEAWTKPIQNKVLGWKFIQNQVVPLPYLCVKRWCGDKSEGIYGIESTVKRPQNEHIKCVRHVTASICVSRMRAMLALELQF